MRIYSTPPIPSQDKTLKVVWKVSTGTADKTKKPADLTYGEDSWGSLQEALIEAAKYPLTKIDIVIDEGVLEEDVEVGSLNLSHVTLKPKREYKPEPIVDKATLVADAPSIIKGKFNLYECALPKIEGVLFNSNNKEVTISRCTSIHSQDLLVYSDFDPATPTDLYALNIRSSAILVGRMHVFAQKGLKIFDGAWVSVSNLLKIECKPDTVPDNYNSDVAIKVASSSLFNVVCSSKLIYNGHILISESSSVVWTADIDDNVVEINSKDLTGTEVYGVIVENNSVFDATYPSFAVVIKNCTRPIVVRNNSNFTGFKIIAERNEGGPAFETLADISGNSSFNALDDLRSWYHIPTNMVRAKRSYVFLDSFRYLDITQEGEIITNFIAEKGSVIITPQEPDLRRISENTTIITIFSPPFGTIDHFNNEIDNDI